MRNDLPVSFYSLFPAQAAVAEREGPNEWSSPCPFCGGRDRFRIFGKSAQGEERYWCRRCNKKGFMNSNRLTPEQLEAYRIKRVAQREMERRERQRRTEELNSAAYWRGYHDGLRDASRVEWRRRGLPDEAQDWFEFGYVDHLDRAQGASALSIPYHNNEWKIETVQYRILGVDGRGKYLFEKGYPGTSFWTDSDGKEDKPFIICEGAIKAAVLFWTLCMVHNRPYTVVGLPSKTPGRETVEVLAEQVGGRRAYLLLDPDASAAEQVRVGSHFDDVRYVALPGKVDDLINDGFSPLLVESAYLKQATVEPL